MSSAAAVIAASPGLPPFINAPPALELRQESEENSIEAVFKTGG
jgi:hypothetical protein